MPDRSYRWAWPYKMLRDGHAAPLLPVIFSYPRPTQSYEGLVDSGAERSACSVAIAREAGIDVERFPEQRIRGIGGVTTARRCPIDMDILGRRVGTEILVVTRDLVILGRHDIFAAFQFGFDERAETLLIEPY